MTIMTSRRAILAGTAMLPALAVPALPAERPGPAEPNADVGLKELWVKLQTAHGRWRAFVDGPVAEANAEHERRAPKRPADFPKMPTKLARQIPTYYGGGKRTDLLGGEYAIMKKYTPKHPAVVWYDKTMAERTIEWNAWVKANDAAGSVEKVEKEAERLYELCYPIYDAIIATPAKTVVGLKIKLQAMILTELEPDGGEVEWKTIRSDILRIADAEIA